MGTLDGFNAILQAIYSMNLTIIDFQRNGKLILACLKTGPKKHYKGTAFEENMGTFKGGL